MRSPFKFNLIETFANDGRVSIKNIDEESGEFLQVNYDLESFGQVLKNIKIAHRAAKRQAREIKKFEKWAEKHTEISQD